MKTVICGVFSIAILTSSAVLGDTPPTSKKDDVVTLQLGKVSVTGRQEVLRALQAIKVGLRTPISGSKKDRNKIVCRIRHSIGSHTQEILTCAPNWVLTKQRMETQTGIMAMEGSIPSGAPATVEAQEILESLTAPQPQQEFNLNVTTRFRPFLDKLPDLAPAAATMTPPAKSDQHQSRRG